MPRPVSIVHQFFTTNKTGGTICNFCNKEYKVKNPTKMTQHLLLRCTSCPDVVRAKFGVEAPDDTPMTERQLKRTKNRKIFERVRRYCVALVKECGRPIEMMDDIPFKNLVNLLVVAENDRKQLTALAIKEFMETSGDLAEDTLDDTAQMDDDDEFDNDGGDSDYAPQAGSTSHKSIKGEKMQCNCQSQDEEGEDNHKIGCPLFSITTLDYWAYFEVSVDDARCKECHAKMKWTTMTDLKTHLDVYHPQISYKDDDDNFNERPLSEASFNADQVAEEIFIETEISPTKPSTAKKRKLPSYQQTPQKYVTLKDSQTITLDKFKCLDRFGLYIAALMKMLPEDKCIKYQEQIVNRLLKEQAAAG